MVDSILQSLLDQRIMAAKELTASTPLGSIFSYQGVLYRITDWDTKTGYISLTNVANPSNAAKNIIVDPLSIIYPNATPAPGATPPPPPPPNPNGGPSGLQNIMSLGQMGLSAYQGLSQQKLLGKSGGAAGGPTRVVSEAIGASGTGPGGTISPNQISSLASANQAFTQAEAALAAANRNLELATLAPANLASAQAKLNEAMGAYLRTQGDLQKATNAFFNPDGSVNVAKLQLEVDNSYYLTKAQITGLESKITQQTELLNSLGPNGLPKGEAGPVSADTTAKIAELKANIASETSTLELLKQDPTATQGGAWDVATDKLYGAYSNAYGANQSASAAIETSRGSVTVAQNAPQNVPGYLPKSQAAATAAQAQLDQIQTLREAYAGATKDITSTIQLAADPGGHMYDQSGTLSQAQLNTYIRNAGLDPHQAADFTSSQIQAVQDLANQDLAKYITPDTLQKAQLQIYGERFSSDPNEDQPVPSLNDSDVMKRAAEIGRAQAAKDGGAADTAWNASHFKTEAIEAAGAAIGAATSGYYEFDSISGMMQKGFSFSGMMKAAGSIVGMMTSMHFLNSALSFADGHPTMLLSAIKGLPVFGKTLGGALNWMSSGTGSMITAGVIAGAAILVGLKNKISPETQAAEQLNAEVYPSVSAPGGVFSLSNLAGTVTAAGVTLASLGITMGPSAPSMQTLTIPQSQITTALNTATGGNMPTGANRYSALFYIPSTQGQPTQVAYITQAGTSPDGKITETLHFETLSSKFTVATTQNPTSYLPFFMQNKDGSYSENSQLLVNQQHLLQCADGTNVLDAQYCVNHGGVLPHTGS